MSRPMSTLLQVILNRMEINGSAFRSLDEARQYGDVTTVEHSCLNRIIGRWSNTLDEHTLHNVTAKKIAFKTLIRDTLKNESMPVR